MNKEKFGWHLYAREGWSTKEEIAKQLECSPDRVREVLAPGLKDGVIEVKDLRVWEAGRMIRKTGYRKAIAKKVSKKR